jgi:hypothetical protein
MNIIINIFMIIIIAAGGEALSIQHQFNISLWYLATDSSNRNAKLIQIGLPEQKVVKEVVLPSDMTVASALWSPDMQSIAAVILDREDLASDSPDSKIKLCIFSNTGEVKECRELSVLIMFRQPHDLLPAPIAWSENSRDLFVVVNQEVNNYQKLQVLALNTEPLTISATVNVNLDFDSIRVWEWAPDEKRAAVYTSNKELYAIDFTDNPAETFLLTSENPSWPAWSGDQRKLVYDTFIPLAPEDVDPLATDGEIQGAYKLSVAQWDENGVFAIEHLDTPVFNGREILPFGFSSTTGISDTDQLAFTNLEGIAEPPYGTRVTLYSMETNTSQVSYLWKVEHENSTLRINNLTWAPGGYYLAGEVCIGFGLLGADSCQIGIWTVEGDFIPVDTGYPENRDPQWLTNP